MTTKRLGKVKVLKWSVRNNSGAGHEGAGASPQHKGGTLTLHSTLPGRRAHSAGRDNIILINHWPLQRCAVGWQICHNHSDQNPQQHI